MRHAPRRRAGRFELFLLLTVCFGVLALGATAGGAGDIGLAGVVISAFSGRAAWRARPR